VPEKGLAYPRNVTAGLGVSFVITLDDGQDGFTIEIPNHEIQRDLRGISQTGEPVANSSFSELQVFAEDALADTAVLSTAFLSQVSNITSPSPTVSRNKPGAFVSLWSPD
jgi:hypothetical protein